MKSLLSEKKSFKGDIPNVRDLRKYIKIHHKLPPNATEEEMAAYIEMADTLDDEEVKANAPTGRVVQIKKGSADGETFDSKWEYAVWLYYKYIDCTTIERNHSEFVFYTDETGKKRKFFYDFLVGGLPVEVKGRYRPSDICKMEQHPEIQFLDSSNIKGILKEVYKHFPDWVETYQERF